MFERPAFQPLQEALDSFVPIPCGQSIIIGDIKGDEALQELEFCVVSSDRECTTTDIPGTCI
ncbi:hypothetical protein BGZ74_005594 [Mortierella antarctica]|nr:hypothetical protein BGZ74_005594 [Mortierella antarctica]